MQGLLRFGLFICHKKTSPVGVNLAKLRELRDAASLKVLSACRLTAKYPPTTGFGCGRRVSPFARLKTR